MRCDAMRCVTRDGHSATSRDDAARERTDELESTIARAPDTDRERANARAIGSIGLIREISMDSPRETRFAEMSTEATNERDATTTTTATTGATDALIDASRAVMVSAARGRAEARFADEARDAVERLRKTHAEAPSERRALELCAIPCVEILRANVSRMMEESSAPSDVEATTAPKDVARRRRLLESALRTTGEAMTKSGEDCTREMGLRIFSGIVGVLSLPRRGEYETVCMEVLEATRAFCAAASTEVQAAFRGASEIAPMLGFTISTLLAISHEETSAGSQGSKLLRSSALNTLDCLIRFVADADALAFFLPGTVSGLTKALIAASGVRPNVGAGPGGTGADGVEFALSSMASILSCVLNDSLYESELGDSAEGEGANALQSALGSLVARSIDDQLESNAKNMSRDMNDENASVSPANAGKDLKVVRDKEWLSLASSRVEAALLATIPPLASHQRATVRLATGKMASSVLKHCAKVLGAKTRRRMMECLLTLAGDSWAQVSTPILEDLRSLDNLGYVVRADLEAIIKDDLSNIADTLRDSSDKAVGHLQRLLIALEFAGARRLKETLFARPSSREHLCSTIAECLLIETFSSQRRDGSAQMISLIDLTEASVSTAQGLPRAPPRLQYFPDASMYKSFAKMLRLLGRAASITNESSLETYFVPMAQYFLGTLRNDAELDALGTAGAWQRNAAAHLIALNEMLFGAITESAVEREYLVRVSSLIVEEYVCSEVWNLDAAEPDNALLLRVLMEGMGIIGEGLGKDHIRTSAFLTNVLCPLLDKLGEESLEVRDTAALVLLKLAQSGEYNSTDDSPIASLVVANADYVVDMLSRQMRHLDKHSRAPRLFAAILRRTDAAKSMVKLLAEPIRLALRTFLIVNREKNAEHSEDFLLVMNEYCSAVLLEVREIETHSRGVVASIQKYHPEEPDSEDENELTEVFVEEMRSVLSQDIETTRTQSLERVRRLQAMVGCAIDLLRSVGALLESPYAGIRSLSATACSLALESLSAAESALAHDKYVLKVLKAYGGRNSTPFDVASLYKDARVLPHIHNIWPHAVSSLSDRFQISIQAEAYEASLSLLRTMASTSGGDFIAKRMNSDLWPILSRVLQQGVCHVDKRHRSLELLTLADTVDASFIAESEISSELTRRIRIKICDTLESIASCEKSKQALHDLLGAAVPVVAKLAMEDDEALRLVAANATRAFAKVNGDEVWLYSMATAARGGLLVDIPTPVWSVAPEAGSQRVSLPPVSAIVPECCFDGDRKESREATFAANILKSLVL